MRQFDVAFEGVCSLRDIETSKAIVSPISKEEISKNMRELKSKLSVSMLIMLVNYYRSGNDSHFYFIIIEKLIPACRRNLPIIKICK